LTEARRRAADLIHHAERLFGLIGDQVRAEARGEHPLPITATARLLLAVEEHGKNLEALCDELTLDSFEARRPLDGSACP
jgi:hypothetical protein